MRTTEKPGGDKIARNVSRRRGIQYAVVVLGYGCLGVSLVHAAAVVDSLKENSRVFNDFSTFDLDRDQQLSVTRRHR